MVRGLHSFKKLHPYKLNYKNDVITMTIQPYPNNLALTLGIPFDKTENRTIT